MSAGDELTHEQENVVSNLANDYDSVKIQFVDPANAYGDKDVILSCIADDRVARVLEVRPSGAVLADRQRDQRADTTAFPA